MAQTPEVDQRQRPAVDEQGALLDPALRQLCEPVPQPEVVKQSQRAGMHRVAAEVTQEVGVLLQQGDFDTGPGQQQAQYHARGTAAGDHACRRLGHGATLVRCCSISIPEPMMPV